MYSSQKTISLIVLTTVIVSGMSYWWFGKTVREVQTAMADSISMQSERLQTLTLSINTPSATMSRMSVVTDCSIEDRVRFDTLLSSLSTINRADLLELNQLFAVCAFYYTSARQIGTAELEREVSVYKDMVSIATMLHHSPELDDQIRTWERFIEVEKTLNILHTELVTIQQQIVVALLAGKLVDSTDVQLFVAKAQEVRGNISYQGQQIDQLRTELLSS